MMKLRDYTYLGTTQSLCPECLAVVPAKIIARRGRVYFRKRCSTHGPREDYICSDVGQYDRTEYSVPGRVLHQHGVEPRRGCPYDCGLCTEHEQHTCVALVEITSSCNLNCPLCFAHSGPGGKHLSLAACRRAIDRLVEVEQRPEVLQLSGGEPTIHPEFLDILAYACSRPIDVVMINSNGVRFAHDEDFVRRVAEMGPRVEVYFQLDGFRDSTSRHLRGESLVGVKLRALESLGNHGVRVTLVSTLQGGVNDDEIGAITRFGIERPWVTGVSFQPATYSGRYVLPETLERRVTFPDVIRGIAEQTGGLFREDDFLPLPCAHPNCHSLTYAYRAGGTVLPLVRIIDARRHPDLLANGIMFTRPRARRFVEDYLARVSCCGGNCGQAIESRGGNGTDGAASDPLVVLSGQSHDNGRRSAGALVANSPVLVPDDNPAVRDFVARALSEDLSTADVFRITITSFLDAYNFDIRRLMQCCTHHVLPSGHVIPFCAYNVLYRDGHVALPELRNSSLSKRATATEAKA